MKKYTGNKEFNDIMLDAIDEAFSSLGVKVRVAIFSYLESKFLIPKNDIPYRVYDFLDAIEQIFGVAAKPLEILIMKKLHEKVTCSYSWSGPRWLIPDLPFSEYVELLRLCYEDTGRIGIVEVMVDAGEEQEQKI